VPRRFIATVLIGPSALRREGILRVLGSTDFRVIALGADLGEIEFASLSEQRDIIFIIDCSHDISVALEQIGCLKAEFPGSHVVLLAEHSTLEGIISAFQAGVNAYLANVHSGDAFVKALELVMLGETILPAELLNYLKEAQESRAVPPGANGADQTIDASTPDALPRLSEREEYILRCIVDGASNKQIARRLNIAEATVKVHVKAILRKIRVQNRTQAAIWAISRHPGLVTLKADMAPTLALNEPSRDRPQVCNGNPVEVLPPADGAIVLIRDK
jgi:two-component system, NarL family, nitrate/nitrite response regulator NarL